jgi:hypothetical protein
MEKMTAEIIILAALTYYGYLPGEARRILNEQEQVVQERIEEARNGDTDNGS